MGFVPVLGEFADGVNAIIYAFNGDYINAGFSLGAMIPIAGWFSTGTKYGIKAVDAIMGGKVVIEGGKAVRSVGKYLESVDDVMANPTLLKGQSPIQVHGLLGKTPGWQVESLGKGGHKGQGMVLREYGAKGSTGRMIQWHPGGGHHGPNPYWKVSNGTTTIRIF